MLRKLRTIFLGNALLNIFVCKIYCVISYKLRNRIAYRELFGEKLDLNDRKTFSAELIYRMRSDEYLNDLPYYVDKYTVREYVEKNIGKEYLIPLIGVYDKTKDISWDNIPLGSYLKTNNGSRFNLVYKTPEKHLFYEFILQQYLTIDYSHFAGEVQYKRIDPKIIIEQNITQEEFVKLEYKCFVFNNKVEFIHLNNDLKQKCIVDSNGNIANFSYIKKNCDLIKIDKSIFNNVIKLAEKLSAPFGFVRADFISCGNKIYFSELTFSPYAGLSKFHPDEYNYIFGEKLKETNIINKVKL